MFGKKKQEKGINANDVMIVIEKFINKDLIKVVAKFTASQSKNSSNSLVLVNSDVDFKEELDFAQNAIITFFKIQLDLKDKSKEDKLAIIKSSISKQYNLVKSIKEGYAYIVKTPEVKDKRTGDVTTEAVIDKIKVNSIDEQNKLKTLEVLREHIIDYDEKGGYETINMFGMREMRFTQVDGFLYPVYRSPNRKTMYTDMVTKKKVYKVESDLAKKQFEEENKSFLSGFWKNFWGLAMVVLMFVLIFGVISNQAERAKIDENLDVCRASLTEVSDNCAYSIAKFAGDNVDLMLFAKDTMSNMKNMTQYEIDKNKPISNDVKDRVINEVIDTTRE